MPFPKRLPAIPQARGLASSMQSLLKQNVPRRSRLIVSITVAR